MSSSAVLPIKVPPIGVLTPVESSANLGLSLLSPVITILRDDFSASADLAQLVLSAFMVSVVISQLISGSLSDRFGRKKILLSDLVIFIFGGIGALLSTTTDMLIGFRILQGAGAAACMTMGGLLIAVLSYLFIDESRRRDPVLFRPAPLINAYLALLTTLGVMFHGLTSGLVVGVFFAMGGAMPYAFDRMGIGPLEYGLSTPLLLSFLCFSFGVCNGLVIALGGADYFSVTATGLLIMTPCAVLSSFLAPNSR